MNFLYALTWIQFIYQKKSWSPRHTASSKKAPQKRVILLASDIFWSVIWFLKSNWTLNWKIIDSIELPNKMLRLTWGQSFD